MESRRACKNLGGSDNRVRCVSIANKELRVDVAFLAAREERDVKHYEMTDVSFSFEPFACLLQVAR